MSIEIQDDIKIYNEDFNSMIYKNIKPTFELLKSMGIDYKKNILDADFQTVLSINKKENEKIQYKVKSLLETDEFNKIIQKRITEEVIIEELKEESEVTKTIIEQKLISFAYRIREAIKRGDDDYFKYVRSPYIVPVTYFDNENRIELYNELRIDYKKYLYEKKCIRQGSAKKDEINITRKKNELLKKYESYIEKIIIFFINRELNKGGCINIHALKNTLIRILEDMHIYLDKLASFSLKIKYRDLLIEFVIDRINLEENPKNYEFKSRYETNKDILNNKPDILIENEIKYESDAQILDYIVNLYRAEIKDETIALYNKKKNEIKENK